MRAFSILTFAIIGFVSGCILGIALEGGFENPSNSLCLGLLIAIASALLQWSLVFPPNEPSYAARLQAHRRRLNRRPRGPRQETEGSFNDRMQRFAANVNQPTISDAQQSKMPLWIADDCRDFTPSPPKSIGVIRMLLQRIRRVLTGN